MGQHTDDVQESIIILFTPNVLVVVDTTLKKYLYKPS